MQITDAVIAEIIRRSKADAERAHKEYDATGKIPADSYIISEQGMEALLKNDDFMAHLKSGVMRVLDNPVAGAFALFGLGYTYRNVLAEIEREQANESASVSA